MSDKILGNVTAYADAVAGGYTGTKEEWEAMLAGLPADAQTASEAAQRAETAAGAVDGVIDTVTELKNETKTLHDEVMQQESANKQDKDENAVEGNVAVFDGNGNTVDSEIGGGELVVHPGNYDDLNVGLAKNLQDPKATPASASFGFRTAAGDVSISDDSNGEFSSFQGVTHVINQEVKPSTSKTADGDGSIQVTDGYAGAAESLVLRGDTYVSVLFFL